MARVVLCPVCKGAGKVPNESSGGTVIYPTTRDCHGCDGDGWVEIEKTDYHCCYPTYEFTTYYPYTIPYDNTDDSWRWRYYAT